MAMENITMNGTQDNRTHSGTTLLKSPVWMLSQVLLVFFVAATTWIILSMFHYGLKNGEFRCWKRQGKKNPLLFNMVFYVILSSVLRFASCQAMISVAYFAASDEFCQVTFTAHYFAIQTNLTGVYLTHWARQELLFRRPSMAHVVKSWRRPVTVLCILALIVNNAIAPFLLFPYINLQISPVGCFAKRAGPERTLFNTLHLVSSAIVQATLLVLFLYPIYDHTKRAQVAPQAQARNDRSLLPLIKRCLGMAVFCVSTDLLSAIARIAIAEITGRSQIIVGFHVFFILLEANAFFNNLSILFMLKDWKPILCSLLRRSNM